MGSDSNFCNCKNLSDDSFSNMICPTDYSRTSVKKEFITNSINKNISKEELIKSQAVNKIIRNYRNYIKNKTTKEGLLVNDYSNNNNSENEDKIKSYKKINFLKNSNYLNDNNTLEKENDKNDNTKGLKKIKYNKNFENISDRLKNSNASLRTLYIGGGTKDQKEGFGINIWLDDAKYIGYFKNNKAEGYGKFIGGNDIYLGEFKEDAESGFGIFTNEELTYEGYWENDKPETIGEEIWTDGALYRGEYHMGQKRGWGCTLGPMVPGMRVSGIKTLLMDSVFFILMKINIIQANGRIKRNMDQESLFGLIKNLQDIILIIKKKDSELLYGKMEKKHIWVFGKMGINQALGNL